MLPYPFNQYLELTGPIMREICGPGPKYFVGAPTFSQKMLDFRIKKKVKKFFSGLTSVHLRASACKNRESQVK
jgi:hypothetical protein